MDVTNEIAIKWVEETARVTQPDSIYWLNGSEEEFQVLVQLAEKQGILQNIISPGWEGSYTFTTDADSISSNNDIHYVCTETKREAVESTSWARTAQWANSDEMSKQISFSMAGAMEGKTMYVVPCLLGTENSPFTRVGIDVTDSLYVVLNLFLTSIIGDRAWRFLKGSSNFYKGVHISYNPAAKATYAVFPKQETIYAINTSYAGYAFMPSVAWGMTLTSSDTDAKEVTPSHMMVLGIENPEGEVKYIAAASPSQGGKSNLASILPPEGVAEFAGYRCFSVSDDITWLHRAADGTIWAVNPTSGINSSLKYISEEQTPNVFNSIKQDSLFTNVARNQADEPWWIDRNSERPTMLKDVHGNIVHVDDNTDFNKLAAGSRFTKRTNVNRQQSEELIYTSGVPISAILFITQDKGTTPILMESESWQNGVLFGTGLSSGFDGENTKFNPMGILPYLSKSMGEYMHDWLKLGKNSDKLPRIYLANWYREDEFGNRIWPGYRENFRILEWIFKRCNEEVDVQMSKIGNLPYARDVNLKGLNMSNEHFSKNLLNIDFKKMDTSTDYFQEFLDDLHYVPDEIWEEFDKMDKTIREEVEAEDHY